MNRRKVLAMTATGAVVAMSRQAHAALTDELHKSTFQNLRPSKRQYRTVYLGADRITENIADILNEETKDGSEFIGAVGSGGHELVFCKWVPAEAST